MAASVARPVFTPVPDDEVDAVPDAVEDGCLIFREELLLREMGLSTSASSSSSVDVNVGSISLASFRSIRLLLLALGGSRGSGTSSTEDSIKSGTGRGTTRGSISNVFLGF